MYEDLSFAAKIANHKYWLAIEIKHYVAYKAALYKRMAFEIEIQKEKNADNTNKPLFGQEELKRD